MVLAFSALPEDIVLRILEIICADIVNEITDLCGGEGTMDSARGLREYSQLCLVSTQFHSLLWKYVRVDSLLLRPHLISLQIMAFSSILNHFTQNDLVPQEFGFARLYHYQRLLGAVQVEKRCGPVWNNPYFPKLFTRLFGHTAVLDPALLLLLLYHGTPKVAKSRQKSQRNLWRTR
jgi:hypothetical protein